MTLQRLVLDYRTGELVVRCLYRSDGAAGPGTNARRREVSNLIRTGLTQALEIGHVDVVGVSGFTQREDILAKPTRSSNFLSKNLLIASLI